MVYWLLKLQYNNSKCAKDDKIVMLCQTVLLLNKKRLIGSSHQLSLKIRDEKLLNGVEVW